MCRSRWFCARGEGLTRMLAGCPMRAFGMSVGAWSRGALVAVCLVLLPAKEAGAHVTAYSSLAMGTSVITSSDSSACTVKAANPARGSRYMNKEGGFARITLAWLFGASCDGGANEFEIRVHPDFTETEAAKAAQKYGKDVGRLPKVLRTGTGTAKGIRILLIHKGSHHWSASRVFGKIWIYTERRSEAYHEEVLVHEAAHVSLDGVISDPGWLAAQKADGAFISNYAKSHPQREDVAESFLAYLAARYLPSRISRTWETKIFRTIPNRIAWFDALLSASDMKPFTRTSPRVAGLEVNESSLKVDAGAAATYDLRLLAPPDAAVTVTPASGAAKVATVSGPLTFTTGNWHVPQTVTVTGAGGGQASISHTTASSDSDYKLAAATLPGLFVTVAGNPVSLSVSGTGAIAEGGSALTVTAALGRANATGAALAIPVRVRTAGTTAATGDYTLAGTISVADGAGSGATDFAVVDDSEDEPGETVVVELGSPLPAGLSAGAADHITIAIADNDATAVTLTVPDTSATEGDASDTAAIALTLNRGLVAGESLAAPLAFAGGALGTDFTLAAPGSPPAGVSLSGSMVTFAGPVSGTGAASVTLTLGVVADALTADRTVTVSIPSSSTGTGAKLTATGLDGGAVGARTGDGRITLKDSTSNAPLAVSIAAGRAVTEGGKAVFTLTASPPPAADLPVSVTVATAGDYGVTAGSRTVSIPTTGSYTLTLTTTGDERDEADGSVTVTVTDGDGYTVGSSASGSVTVTDDDETGTPDWTDYQTVVNYLIQVRDHPENTSVQGNPAHIAKWNRVLAALGHAGPEQPMAASEIHANAAKWPDSPFKAASVYLTSREQQQDEPEITVSAGNAVTEGGSATFTVTADPAPTSPLPVSVSVTASGAYGVTAGTQTVTIPTTGSATLTLTTTGDDTDEPDGSVTVTVTDGEGYTVGDPASGSVTVRDDDAAEPVVSIAAGNAVTEGSGAEFTLTANPVPSSPLAVSVTVAAAGDYGVTAGAQTVTIPTTGSFTLTLTTTGDEQDEPDGSVTVTVNDDDGYTVGSSASGSVTVRDDDDAPPPAGTVLPGTVAAPLSNGVVTVARPSGWTGSGKVQFGGGPAKARDKGKFTTLRIENADNDSFEVRWASRDPGTQRLTLEWQPVAGSSWQPSDGDAQDPRVLTIEDPAPTTKPTVTVTGGSAVTEGAAASFTVSRTGGASAALTVRVAVSEDGTGGRDFVAPGDEGDKQVVIQAGSAQATYTVPTGADGTDEPDGEVILALRDDGAYTRGSPSSATVAVRDDDGAPLPEVTVSAGDAVTEGGSATFTLTANPVPSSPLAVSVTVAADGAYGVAGGAQTVTIPTTGSATLTLTTTGDERDEADGSVTVTVTDGDGYTVGSPASGSVTVRDDDDAAEPVVSIAAGNAVTEGASASFTLTANPTPTAPLAVTVAVAADGDYGVTAGTQTVSIPTTGSYTLTLTTTGDDTDEPDGSVTVTVGDGDGYTVGSSASGSVTVRDDDDAALLPVLSVADATVTEGSEALLMTFTVRLSAPAPDTVRVSAETRDSTPVSASARDDYWPERRQLRFRPGQTERDFAVLIFDDSHDEGTETFELVLSDAEGATIGDGVAVGSIENTDPLPQAWLGRLGRTLAGQAVDGVTARMNATRESGLVGVFAGRAFRRGHGDAGNATAASAPAQDSLPPWQASPAADPAFSRPAAVETVPHGNDTLPAGAGSRLLDWRGPEPYTQHVNPLDLLSASAFAWTGDADDAGGALALWGRGAQGHFDGQADGVTLDGRLTTGLLGADYARDNWLAGLAVSRSEGAGQYQAPDTGGGALGASLTAVLPYAAWQAGTRLSLWGAAGYGAGQLTLRTPAAVTGHAPDTAPGLAGPSAAAGDADSPLKTDLGWALAAGGLRSEWFTALDGPSLALTADALWTRTTSDKTAGLLDATGEVTRLRVGLEGRWPLQFARAGALTPTLTTGLRHDGGDAETGLGVELGGGLAWALPRLGLSLDIHGRTLLTHADRGIKDRGVSAALQFDPRPASALGLSVSLRQDWGGAARGGLDALFADDPLSRRRGAGTDAARWTLEAAWGLALLKGRFIGAPTLSLGTGNGARDLGLGWQLTPALAYLPALRVSLEAVRRHHDGAGAEHGVLLEGSLAW